VRLVKTPRDAVEPWTIERPRSSVGGRPAAQVGSAVMLDAEAAEDASCQSPGFNLWTFGFEDLALLAFAPDGLQKGSTPGSGNLVDSSLVS
jgi:hypothetical protein